MLCTPLCPNMFKHTCHQALRMHMSLLMLGSDKVSAVYVLLIMQPELVLGATQVIRSNDICLQPHGAVAVRTPSRGDSAADAVLDTVIAPVLQKQQAVPESDSW